MTAHSSEPIQQFKSFCVSVVSFNEEEWNAMESCLQVKTIPKNEHFLREGEVCTRMGFITKGYTRLYFLSEGEDITKDFCFENSFTGGSASFFSRKPGYFNVVSMEDTELVLLDYTSLMALYKDHQCWNTLGRLLVEAFAIRKEKREVTFLLNSPEERYKELLKEHPYMLQRVPLKFIASFLGMTPETLSRVRNKVSNTKD